MKQILRDPSFIISVIMAAIGAVQAQTSFLSDLSKEHPLLFGLAMMLLSVSMAVLAVFKVALAARDVRAAEAGRDSGV